MTEQEEVVMRSVALLSLVPLLATAIGCSSSICDGLAAAEKAVLEARAAGARQYLADEFATLEASLAEVRLERDRQGKKLILFRDYSKARERGAWIEAEAARVIAATSEKKQRARTLALEALARARQTVQATRVLASGPAHRALHDWAEAVKEDCSVMMDALERVEGVIAAGEYDAAILKSEVIEEASRVLTRAIKTASSALEGVSGKKSARFVPHTGPSPG